MQLIICLWRHRQWHKNEKSIKSYTVVCVFTDNIFSQTTPSHRQHLFPEFSNDYVPFTNMEEGIIYFYTATILNWIHLLQSDKFKLIILNSLTYLIEKERIKVYGFVIMPNHIHLIWENLSPNGKEAPHASFMKFTAHQFLTELKTDNSLL
jgi:hypothetical protein